MNLQLYLLTFKNAHFGEGLLNESSDAFSAHRLYSALYLEALKMEKSEEFFKESLRPDFIVSDAFPFFKEVYLPRPIGFPRIENKYSSIEEFKENVGQAKTSKKIMYIPLSCIDDFIAGKAIVNQLYELQKDFLSILS